MEIDCCALLEAADPKYERFADAHYFESDASSDDGLYEDVPLVTLEYIKREAGEVFVEIPEGPHDPKTATRSMR